MNEIADQFAPQGVGSIFLYTHEAHPGDYYPHLTTMQQKRRHARDVRDQLGVMRPILLDGLDGAMPNMSWNFNQAGIPVYKSDWTDSHSVRNAIEYFLQVIQRRRSGERIVGSHVERLDYRILDHDAFYRGLARNGPKAVREFSEAFD